MTYAVKARIGKAAAWGQRQGTHGPQGTGMAGVWRACWPPAWTHSSLLGRAHLTQSLRLCRSCHSAHPSSTGCAAAAAAADVPGRPPSHSHARMAQSAPIDRDSLSRSRRLFTGCRACEVSGGAPRRGGTKSIHARNVAALPLYHGKVVPALKRKVLQSAMVCTGKGERCAEGPMLHTLAHCEADHKSSPRSHTSTECNCCLRKKDIYIYIVARLGSSLRYLVLPTKCPRDQLRLRGSHAAAGASAAAAKPDRYSR